MAATNRQAPWWLWLTVPIALLLAIAAASGRFIGHLYRDAPAFAAQAAGQDLVSLAVVLPVLVASAILAGRGSERSRLVWMGVIVYLVYTYLIAAFDVAFNALFLVYVGILGFSLYALIGGIVSADAEAIRARFTERAPVRAVSIYLAVLTVLFYLLWLKEIVPAVAAGGIPQSIRENGTPTNGVHVLDMAWVLPALGFTAVSLWRKRPLGYLFAGTALTYIALLALAVFSMVLSMARSGIPVLIPLAALFALLFLTSTGFLTWYLAGLKQPPCDAVRIRTDAGRASHGGSGE